MHNTLSILDMSSLIEKKVCFENNIVTEFRINVQHVFKLGQFLELAFLDKVIKVTINEATMKLHNSC